MAGCACGGLGVPHVSVCPGITPGVDLLMPGSLRVIADEIVEVGEDATLDGVADLLPLDAHSSETFAFVGRDVLAPDVVALFQDALRRSERLGAVFVTQSGRSCERLLGMLTSWDMAAFF
jgi:hypothetical protein